MTAGFLDKLHAFYKLCISPFFGTACRFVPSCSDYSLEAVKRFGVLRGSVLSLKRVLRCNPCCTGGFDPVPSSINKKTENCP